MAGFKKLSWAVSLFEPRILPGKEDGTNLSTTLLVVICSWMGAQSNHLVKYTEGYQRLFPGASIMIIQCSVLDAIFPGSSRWHQVRIRRALDVIRGSQTNHNDTSKAKRPPLIIHAFSNGGSFTASLLLTDLSNRKKELCDALILDSCPGQGTFWRTAKAFIVATRAHKTNTVIKAVLSTVAYIGVTLGLALPNMIGIENTVSATRRSLNDVSIVGLSVPRLYVYSKADQMVLWHDVLLHVKEAQQKGYTRVKEVVLGESKHCAHVLKDPKRYWDAVSAITSEAATSHARGESWLGIPRL